MQCGRGPHTQRGDSFSMISQQEHQFQSKTAFGYCYRLSYFLEAKPFAHYIAYCSLSSVARMVMRALLTAALAATASVRAQMPLDDHGQPKFGQQTFDPSDFPVSE